jgi:integrase
MSDVPTFSAFAAEALDIRGEDGVRGISSERNRYELHIATAAFAPMALPDIRSIHLRDWLRAMAQKDAADTRGVRKISADTIKRSFSLVSAVFAAAVERELVDSNPCIGVRVKKRADEASTREKWGWLTLDEQKLLVACQAIPSMDRLMIRFAIGTGLRQGEQCNLELTDLHIGTDSPHVFVRYGSRGRLPPKNGKTRRVPLFGDALVAAREWVAALPTYAPKNPHGLVFPTARGRHRAIGKPMGAGGKLKRYLTCIGVTRRVRWHDLRHTFCSNLVSGVLGRRWTLEEIRPLAGHSSIGITERYAHIGEAELVKAAEATSFAHGPLMPLAAAEDDAPDTQRDVTTWAEAEAS